MSDLPLAMIANIAAANGLDPHLVAAIVMQESSGNPLAIRYEPQWRYLVTPDVFAKKLNITTATETVLQSCSYGYMQIMGSVSRELGYNDALQLLCEEDLGLQFGCKQLARLQARYPKLQETIAAYNGGSPRRNAAGVFDNQSYIDSVMDHLISLSA